MKLSYNIVGIHLALDSSGFYEVVLLGDLL